MSYHSHSPLGWRPRGLGQRPRGLSGDIDSFDLVQAFKKQDETLAKMEKDTASMLKWRKIATIGTLAGALFALVRLSDIYFAVKARKGKH